MKKSRKHTWIVIPAYKESRRITSLLEKVVDIHSQIIVVDDGSHDKTATNAQPYASYILQHEINLGKGAALKTGCEFAFNSLKAQAVIFMDGDGQHDPEELQLFFSQLEKKQDIVFGYRKEKYTMPIYKRLGNAFTSQLVRVLFGKYIPDILSGYKALSKKGYQQVKWKAQRYEVEMEIAARVAVDNIAFATIPISTIYRPKERAMNLLDAVTIMYYLVLLRAKL